MEKLLTTEDVAEILGLTLGVVRRMRQRGTGPKHVKIGRARQSPVRYEPAQVEAWIAARRMISPKEPAGE